MRVRVVLASVVMAAGTLGLVGEASAQDTDVFVDTDLELRVARENLEAAARRSRAAVRASQRARCRPSLPRLRLYEPQSDVGYQYRGQR